MVSQPHHHTGAEKRALLAFAAARSFSVSSNNPLALVLPLFEPIATEFHGRLFHSAELSRELSARFGLLVSDELCQFWASQLVKSGLLVPILEGPASGDFAWSQAKAHNTPDAQFASELGEIVDALRSFLQDSGDLFLTSYTDEELVLLLRDGAIGSLFPLLYEYQAAAIKSDRHYVFSRFVSSLESTNKRILDSIDTLRKAAIYAELILNLQTPKARPNNAQTVILYLDSPLVMDAVGLSGPVRKAFTERFLREARTLGFEPWINPGMVFEVKNNIRAILQRHPRDRFGPTADALRKGQIRIDFVQAVLERLETVVETAGIKIDAAFDTYAAKSNFTSQRLDDFLSGLHAHYQHAGAAERDAEVIRGVYARRAANLPDNIFRSRAIFVTSNVLLAALTNRYFRKHFGYRPGKFPVVVTRPTLAAIIDATTGVATTEKVSLAELLVSAADATQYNPDVFRSIEARLAQMSPDHASELLEVLQRPDLSQLAMDIVSGSPSHVNSDSITELSQRVQARLELEAESKVAAARSAERSANAKTLQEQGALIAERTIAIRTLSDELARSRERHISTLMRQLKGRSDRLALLRSLIALSGYMLGAICFLAAYAATYFSDYLAHDTFARFCLSFAIGLITGMPLIGSRTLRERVIDYVTRREDKSFMHACERAGLEVPGCDLSDVNKVRVHFERYGHQPHPALAGSAPAKPLDLFGQAGP